MDERIFLSPAGHYPNVRNYLTQVGTRKDLERTGLALKEGFGSSSIVTMRLLTALQTTYFLRAPFTTTVTRRRGMHSLIRIAFIIARKN